MKPIFFLTLSEQDELALGSLRQEAGGDAVFSAAPLSMEQADALTTGFEPEKFSWLSGLTRGSWPGTVSDAAGILFNQPGDVLAWRLRTLLLMLTAKNMVLVLEPGHETSQFLTVARLARVRTLGLVPPGPVLSGPLLSAVDTSVSGEADPLTLKRALRSLTEEG